jgi:hypothetical protein
MTPLAPKPGAGNVPASEPDVPDIEPPQPPKIDPPETEDAPVKEPGERKPKRAITPMEEDYADRRAH